MSKAAFSADASSSNARQAAERADLTGPSQAQICPNSPQQILAEGSWFTCSRAAPNFRAIRFRLKLSVVLCAQLAFRTVNLHPRLALRPSLLPGTGSRRICLLCRPKP